MQKASDKSVNGVVEMPTIPFDERELVASCTDGATFREQYRIRFGNRHLSEWKLYNLMNGLWVACAIARCKE